MNEWLKNYVGKKVYIILSNDRRYVGKIISIEETKVTLLDRNSMYTTIDESEIKVIEEER